MPTATDCLAIQSLSGSVVLNALLNWMLANDIDAAESER